MPIIGKIFTIICEILPIHWLSTVCLGIAYFSLSDREMLPLVCNSLFACSKSWTHLINWTHFESKSVLSWVTQFNCRSPCPTGCITFCLYRPVDDLISGFINRPSWFFHLHVSFLHCVPDETQTIINAMKPWKGTMKGCPWIVSTGICLENIGKRNCLIQGQCGLIWPEKSPLSLILGSSLFAGR